MQLQENLKTETHVSETDIRSLKLEENEFKFKLLQSEGIISSFKKQLGENDENQLSNNKTHVQLQNTIYSLADTIESLNRTAQVVCEELKQLQATIGGLTKTEEANKRTVQELREKQKQLQATIDGQTKTEEANNRTVLELCKKQEQLQSTIDILTKTDEAKNQTLEETREKQKQLQATIDGLTIKAEALNQTVQLLCGRMKDVSICKLQAVTTSKRLKSLRLRI